MTVLELKENIEKFLENNPEKANYDVVNRYATDFHDYYNSEIAEMNCCDEDMTVYFVD